MEVSSTGSLTPPGASDTPCLASSVPQGLPVQQLGLDSIYCTDRVLTALRSPGHVKFLSLAPHRVWDVVFLAVDPGLIMCSLRSKTYG